MITCDLLKLSFVCNFYNKNCVQLCLVSFCITKYVCVIKTAEMYSFLPLINRWFIIWLSCWSYQQLYYQRLLNFTFCIWVLFFNFLTDILHITSIFNKSLWIIMLLKTNFFVFFKKILIFFFIWILNIYINFISNIIMSS